MSAWNVESVTNWYETFLDTSSLSNCNKYLMYVSFASQNSYFVQQVEDWSTINVDASCVSTARCQRTEATEAPTSDTTSDTTTQTPSIYGQCADCAFNSPGIYCIDPASNVCYTFADDYTCWTGTYSLYWGGKPLHENVTCI